MITVPGTVWSTHTCVQLNWSKYKVEADVCIAGMPPHVPRPGMPPMAQVPPVTAPGVPPRPTAPVAPPAASKPLFPSVAQVMFKKKKYLSNELFN